MSRAAVCTEETDKTGHVSCSERQRERERQWRGVSCSGKLLNVCYLGRLVAFNCSNTNKPIYPDTTGSNEMCDARSG